MLDIVHVLFFASPVSIKCQKFRGSLPYRAYVVALRELCIYNRDFEKLSFLKRFTGENIFLGVPLKSLSAYERSFWKMR